MPRVTKLQQLQRQALRAKGYKTCSACGQTHPHDQFTKDAHAWDGLLRLCRGCLKEKNERSRTPKAFYSASTHSRVNYLLSKARERAKSKGIVFDLSFEWALQQLDSQDYCCARSHMPFVFTNSRILGGATSPWALSFDRIDSAKGYTEDNVQLVCLMYNFAKNAFDDADVLLFASALAAAHMEPILELHAELQAPTSSP